MNYWKDSTITFTLTSAWNEVRSKLIQKKFLAKLKAVDLNRDSVGLDRNDLSSNTVLLLESFMFSALDAKTFRARVCDEFPGDGWKTGHILRLSNFIIFLWLMIVRR